jgi:hypothetical protein
MRLEVNNLHSFWESLFLCRLDKREYPWWKWLATKKNTIDLIEGNTHDEMACNGKERQICEIVDLLVVIALMFKTEEQGKHFC